MKMVLGTQDPLPPMRNRRTTITASGLTPAFLLLWFVGSAVAFLNENKQKNIVYSKPPKVVPQRTRPQVNGVRRLPCAQRRKGEVFMSLVDRTYFSIYTLHNVPVS